PTATPQRRTARRRLATISPCAPSGLPRFYRRAPSPHERHHESRRSSARSGAVATSSASMNAPPRIEPSSTGFGATIFEVAAIAEPTRGGADSAFDVCHVGVVLRALIFVHVAMAIGMVFSGLSLTVWFALVAAGSSVALPAVLAWLLVLCAMKRPLAATAVWLQWTWAIGLGALAAWGSARLVVW